jgi:HlyD family secretion protein
MRGILNFFRSLLKKKSFWVILVIVVGGGGYIAAKTIQGPKAEYVTETVKIGDIKQTVSATGTVTSSDKIELNFKISGTLKEILVSEGDEVLAGQVLAKLDAKNAEIQVKQAGANLSSASASLSKLLAGASVEDVKISQESVNNAKTVYENAKRDYDALAVKLDRDIETYQKNISSAEVSLADSQKNLANAEVTYKQNIVNAQNNALTSLETNLLMGDIVLDNIVHNLSIASGANADGQKTSESQAYMILARDESGKAKNDLSSAKTSGKIDDVYKALDEGVSALSKTLASLTYLADSVSSASASNTSQLAIIEAIKASVKSDQASIAGAISAVQSAEQSLLNSQNSYQAQVDTYQAAVNAAGNNLSSAKTNLSAALASKDVQLSGAKASVDNALGSYNLAKAQYGYKVAAPRSSDISFYRSQVALSSAALDLAKSQLDEYTLLAPTDGAITFVNYTVGEQTSLGKTVISMIGKNKFYTEIDIPESDIVKIKLDNPVQITLDAYSSEIKFSGKVILIYPAETVVQDVVYYKVKVEMENSEYEIKSGMTANCDILTNHKENVLLMPYRALQEKDGRKFVRVISASGQLAEKTVEVGLRGDEGEIEVISGLAAGEKVVVFEKTVK